MTWDSTPLIAAGSISSRLGKSRSPRRVFQYLTKVAQRDERIGGRPDAGSKVWKPSGMYFPPLSKSASPHQDSTMDTVFSIRSSRSERPWIGEAPQYIRGYAGDVVLIALMAERRGPC